MFVPILVSNTISISNDGRLKIAQQEELVWQELATLPEHFNSLHHRIFLGFVLLDR
jgi:hypothetical protein